MKNLLSVRHLNVRLSISTLVLKLLVLEFIAACMMVIAHALLFNRYYDFYTAVDKMVLLGLFSVGVGIKICMTGFIVIQWLDEYYEISSTLITHRKGIFFKKEEKYPLDHIYRIEVFQSMLGKLFNFGTIALYDSRSRISAEMYLVHNPMRYAHILEYLIPRADVKESKIREQVIEPDSSHWIAQDESRNRDNTYTKGEYEYIVN